MTVEQITKPPRGIDETTNAMAATKPPRAKQTDSAAPHVIRAMSLVTARLAEEGVSKSRNNSQQGYKFRGIDEIMNAMAAIIASEKLVIIPHVQARALTERMSKGGTVLFSVVVRVEYTFVSAEDGSRQVVGPFDGEAMDSADKATNKAMSAAYKYMAIQTFCIPTEGDNDADATTHEVAPAAGGERAPSQPPPRQQQTVTNPETGRQIDPNNARNSRDKWARFQDKVRAFTDLDALEQWWADGSTQAAIEQMPWATEAAEEYEKAQERLLDAGRP